MFLSDNSDAMHIHQKADGFKDDERHCFSRVVSSECIGIYVECDVVHESASRGGELSNFGANQVM